MAVIKREIGDLLVDNGLITADEYAAAVKEKNKSGEPMSAVLSRMGLANEGAFKNALELEYGVTYISLSRRAPDPEVTNLLPEEVVRRYMVVPTSRQGHQVTVAMVDPNDGAAMEEVKRHLDGMQIKCGVCIEEDFLSYIELAYHSQIKPQAPSNGDSRSPGLETASDRASDQSSMKPGDRVADQAMIQAGERIKDQLSEREEIALKDESAQEPLTLAHQPAADATGPESQPGIEAPKGSEENAPGHSDREAEAAIGTSDSGPKADSSAVTEAAETAATAAGTAVNDTSATDASVTDTSVTNTSATGTSVTGTSVTDTSGTDTSVAGAAEAGAAAPVTAATDAAIADTAAFDTARTDTARTDRPMAGAPEASAEPQGTAAQDALVTDTPVTGAPEAGSAPLGTTAKDEAATNTAVAGAPETGATAQSAKDAQKQTLGGSGGSDDELGDISLIKRAQEEAIVLLANQILGSAIKRHCSNIHVRIDEKQALVHYRLNGTLFVDRKLPLKIVEALIARFKMMARLNLAERGLPQDGHIKVKSSAKEIVCLVTTVPGQHGENLIIWIV